MNISASNAFILCFISLLVGYLMRYVTEQKDKFNSIDQLSKTTAFLSSNDHSFADINYTADNTVFMNTNEDSEAYTNFIGSIKQLENMAKSDPLVDANYQENIYKYGVNLTNVAKEVERIRKRMQAGRTNSNAQVLDRIYDSIDQLFNLTSFSSNDYIKLLKHRLEETQSSLLDSQKQNQILLFYIQQLKINTPDYHRYIQRLYDERISISNWRAEWDVQLNRTIRKFELDRAIMNSKLMEFGYIYDDELHTVRQLTKDDKAIDINAVNKVIRKTNNNMKSWSLVSVLNHTYCADDKVKKETENSEYNSIFNPKETWRKDSTYLWTDSTTFFKDQFHPLHIDESEGPIISSIYTNLLTILVTYSDKYPTECIASIRKFCPTVNIQPISIGTNYTDVGGQAIYNELMTINTTYVLILDHTVRFNRYTKVDILIYSLMKKYVDVVAGSEEYNDILYPRCYRMVNKFGKVKYQRGYHNGFGFYFKTPNQYIGVAGQICYRTSSYIMTSTDLLKRVWRKNYPLPLAIQAFYFDIQKTHKVGQIPYVTFVHEFSERNTIYKPLQGIEKSVRQAFGQDYNVFIYIDMDNRFTWMPYTPVDFRKRDFPFTMSTQGMVNPLQTIGYSHEYLMLYDKLFHELNIPYAGIAGNLLSAVGFGGLFPWEYDTDFALPIKYKQEENHETAISKLTKGYTKHTTQQQLLNIKDRSNDEDYPGYYCTFLRSIQGHLQEVFNMSRNVFDFTAPGDGCTCGRVTTKADFNSYSDVFDHLINSYQKVIKITTPFKRVKYLGHLVHIPGNWRELLQHNYRYNYFYSNMATNKASAWPMCPAQFKDHPSCLHGEDDIYEYISEMTDEVRYWPDVD